MKIDEKFFKEYGIKNYKDLDLKDFNIIIGKNGAGKTRLLKALKDGLSGEDMSIVYAYFPDMYPNFGTGLDKGDLDVSLFDMIFEGESIDLGDFIHSIEPLGYDFLEVLLVDINNGSRYKRNSRKNRAEKVCDELNGLLKDLIDRQLEFGSEITVTSSIYGGKKSLEDDLKRMSPGELSLFYLCILLITVKYKKDESKKLAVLLDEPELHLHPKALMSFIEFLRHEKTIEICCIATHSIFLVPQFDFYEVIHIEAGEIQEHRSKLYNDICENIIGNNEALVDFLVSRDTWKYYEFIAECFCLPTIVEKVNTNDEQFQKFLKSMEMAEKEKGYISVLDFGAGGGRLGKTLNRMLESKQDIKRKIEYCYYDRYEKKPEDLDCEAFDDIGEIVMEYRKFDYVVLMNVLHEIDINDWKETFNDIDVILDDMGYLLISEVITLLHGEQPYGDNGFILLGEEQIRELFQVSNIDTVYLKDDDKTRTFIIPKVILKNVSKESIRRALESLNRNLRKELEGEYFFRREIARVGGVVSRQVVKNYGFLSQHYLNTLFAIDMLCPGKKTD